MAVVAPPRSAEGVAQAVPPATTPSQPGSDSAPRRDSHPHRSMGVMHRPMRTLTVFLLKVAMALVMMLGVVCAF